MTPSQLRAAEALRSELNWGDRKVAEALGLSYAIVRGARERGEIVPAGDFRTTVVIPDVQYPWVHQPSEKVLMQFIKDTQPEQVIQIGDFMDLYSLAGFRKGMSQQERVEIGGTFQQEVDLGRAKLSEWRELAPDADYTWIEGNHEFRLARYAEDNGGELFGLEALTIESLYQTNERGWSYVGPYMEGMWVGLEGGLWATHGDFVRKWSAWSARAHTETYAHSVIHGHSHRLGAYYQTGAAGMVAAFEVGCLCDRRATPRATSVVNWQTGFAVVYTSTEDLQFWVNLVNIEKGRFVYGGKEWKA